MLNEVLTKVLQAPFNFVLRHVESYRVKLEDTDIGGPKIWCRSVRKSGAGVLGSKVIESGEYGLVVVARPQTRK